MKCPICRSNHFFTTQREDGSQITKWEKVLRHLCLSHVQSKQPPEQPHRIKCWCNQEVLSHDKKHFEDCTANPAFSVAMYQMLSEMENNRAED